MTEKEKAVAGLLYDANYDEGLMIERDEVKNILFKYNHLPPNEKALHEKIIQKLFHKTGKSPIVEPPFYCDYGYNIEVGDNFYSNTNLVILDGAKVTFGDHVFIAPNVGIYTAGHPFDIEQRNAGLEYAYPITIGNNVWIGGGVTILPGVTIGDGAVIGGGSVVAKDIPAGVLAVGNPCRVIRVIKKENTE